MSKLSLRSKLILSYTFFILMPVLFIGLRCYQVSEEKILEIAQRNVHEIIIKNNEILDAELLKIKESGMLIGRDMRLYDYLLHEEENLNDNALKADRAVTGIIKNYFPPASEVYSAQIVTRRFVYGDNTSLFNPEEFRQSSLYDIAKEGNGTLVWIPPYDFVFKFGFFRYDAIRNNRVVFSAVSQLNPFTSVYGSDIRSLPADVEPPTLVVNIRAEMLQEKFKGSIPVKGVDLYIADAKGELIFFDGIKQDYAPFWLDAIMNSGSPTGTLNFDEKRLSLCYDTSRITGWVSVAVMPIGYLMGDTLRSLAGSITFVTLLFIVIALGVAVLFSGKIAKPVKKLVYAMREMESGNLDINITETNKDEFGYLLEQFNDMNKSINLLIEENYAVQLREKEMEINALNLQVNPHFLYNTLSVINYTALENGQNATSDMIMCLCTMLSYTFRNKNETGLLKEELSWLDSYIKVMQFRFEGKFTVSYDIDEALMNCEVPKLFLQPFVENAIIHGFKYTDSGGLLLVSGVIKENNCVFTVQDNGIGLERDITVGENSAIGISNVDKRIKLMYGATYGITVTSEKGAGVKVDITFPMRSVVQ